MPPTRVFLGDTVIYRSGANDGVLSPAIVIRTEDTHVAGLNPTYDNQPLVDGEVDLLVHGLERDYREYKVPFDLHAPGCYFPADRLVQAQHG